MKFGCILVSHLTSVYLSFWPSVYPSIRPSVRLFVCPSVCLSVFLSVRLFVPVFGKDFVHACSDRWVHEFFWKFVHWLLSIWRCAPGFSYWLGNNFSSFCFFLLLFISCWLILIVLIREKGWSLWKEYQNFIKETSLKPFDICILNEM